MVFHLSSAVGKLKENKGWGRDAHLRFPSFFILDL